MTIAKRKHIEVVAAVIEAAGRVLCVQRGPNSRSYISGKWEFPGGKIEAGEAPDAALSREIAEELRIPIVVGPRLISVQHDYPDFGLTMHAYHCALVEPIRSVVLTEHVDSAWLSPRDPAFSDLDWAAADLPIVARLRELAASDSGLG